MGTSWIGVLMPISNVSASSVSHNIGNLKVYGLNDFGSIRLPIQWQGKYQSTMDMSAITYIGLVIDQDNYNHTPGFIDIADCFGTYSYGSQDDFKRDISAHMIIDDGTTQKSKASYENTGTEDPNDIYVDQTGWSMKNKDWFIIQWRLTNLKGVDLTGVSLALEMSLSQTNVGIGGGVGGDSGDDIDGYDAGYATYWVQDDGGLGTCFGVASVMVSDPLTHYYSHDYGITFENTFYENETWLYDRLHAPNTVIGGTPGNRISTVGWNNVNIPAGSSRDFTLVMAINDTFNNMITAMEDARNYYRYEATGFRITEFSDSSSINQRIEIYNFGREPTDLDAEGYFLSVDGGVNPLMGNWDKNPLPAYEYAVFTVSAGVIGPEGDTLGLYQNLGGGNKILLDEVSFGQEGITPDPLNGESVARRYDPAILDYTGEWVRNVSSGPTWGTENDVGGVISMPQVVLNEVMFNPSATPDGRYIVIYNRDFNNPVNVSNYQIVCDDVYRFPLTPPLAPNTEIMINYSSAPALFQSMDFTGDNVYLYDNNSLLLDMVGWSSQHFEGMSVRRVPDGGGTHQGFDDITSEIAGWVFDSPLEVLMTEISDSDSVLTQIEVYNPIYPVINFSVGFTFGSAISGTLGGTWIIPTANMGEHALFQVTSGTVSNEGDTIGIYQNGKVAEEVPFGQYGPAPDPLAGESVARIHSGFYTNNWSRDPTPTFGSINDVPPINTLPLVVLNEVYFNPSNPADKFIELYFRGYEDLNITGWQIVADTIYSIPGDSEATLTLTNRYYHLREFEDPIFFSQMSVIGDNVYLYDNNATPILQDMVGWSSPHDTDKSMTRYPDGNGTADGFDDLSSLAAGWLFDQPPTYTIVLIEEDQEKWGDPGHYVWYSLDITNLQETADFIDVIYESENGWTVELYEADRSTLLTDKEPIPDGLPDTGKLQPDTPYQIWAKVWVPYPPFVGVENTSIFAQASLDPVGGDRAVLKTLVNPWVEPDAYIEDPPYPTTIYEKHAGALGYVNETTVTLNASGIGYSRYIGQDVVFILDSSGSMSWNDPDPDGIPGNIPFPQRVQASWDYVDNLTGEDRGAYVDFDDMVALKVPLTDDYGYLKQDPINGLWTSDQVGGTIINPAITTANQELIQRGSPRHVKVEILLTDAEDISLGDDILCRQAAEIAAQNDIIIFTIGLNVNQPGPPGGVDLLNYIAITTGGQYFAAPDASSLTSIFSQILQMVGDIAGYNPTPGGQEVMIKLTLEQGIDFIDGTFQLVPGTIETNPYPDRITFDPTHAILEWIWSADYIKVWEYWAVRFRVSSTVCGDDVPVNVISNSTVTYETSNGVIVTKQFPLVTINVLPAPITHPRITNVTIESNGVNITWTPVLGAEIYEIYGGPSQISLNLDLADVIGMVLDPQTWWIDSIHHPLYDEYYYVVRAVDIDSVPEVRSSTSNTGGYYIRQFPAGLNTFSLPLKPFGKFKTDYYVTSMNADHIKYMDYTARAWIKHDSKGDNGNGVQMKLGEGYEVKFDDPTTYTFTGMPAAMISYDDDNGFIGFDHANEAKSLSVSVQPNGDVELTWQDPFGMNIGGWYAVYYSNTRDGFFGTFGIDYNLACPTINFGFNTATHNQAQAHDPGARLYYMVIPFNASGIRGSSTYSIGIWTEEYQSQYDTFGIPLKLKVYRSADWFCDNIPDTVGINYYHISSQEWRWHSTIMSEGAYDPVLEMTEGYQISTSAATKYAFIGI